LEFITNFYENTSRLCSFANAHKRQIISKTERVDVITNLQTLPQSRHFSLCTEIAYVWYSQ